MKILCFVVVIIIILAFIPNVSANSVQIGTSIYINDRQNLTEVNADISNASVLQNLGSGEWLLSANLINNLTSNSFYINNSDVSWLKINSTFSNYFNISTNGHIEINNTKITSWNTSTSSPEVQNVDRTLPRAYIYTISSGQLNISNSNMSYLGFHEEGSRYGTTMGIAWWNSSGNIINNNTFIGNYRSNILLSTGSGNTNSNILTNNYYEVGNGMINISGTAESVGIFIYQASVQYNNISNNTIIMFDNTASVGELNMGFFLWLSNNNTFKNNNITNYGDSTGIYVRNSADNLLENNTVLCLNKNTDKNRAVYMGVATIPLNYRNRFTGGNITQAAGSSAWAYFFENNISSNNTFNSTSNWSNANSIRFITADVSGFNQSNDGTTWIYTTTGAAKNTARQVFNWSLRNISISEKWGLSTSTNYSVNVRANRNYSIYNGTNLYGNYTSDSNGTLPSFQINFTTARTGVTILDIDNETAIPQISISNSSANQNANAISYINLSNFNDFGVAQIYLYYNTSIVNVVSASCNFGGCVLTSNINNATGVSSFLIMDVDIPGNNSPLTLVEVTLKAIGHDTTSLLNMTVTTFTDSGGNPSTPTIINGTFTALNETIIYIPPVPVWVSNTTNSSWVNHTWQAGVGNVTDSYNISLNGIWTNGTTNTSMNTSIVPGGWSNITIWAFNNSGGLSATSISNNSQVPAAPSVPSVSNVSSYVISTCNSTLNWGIVGAALLTVLLIVVGGGLAFGFMSRTIKMDTFPIQDFVIALIAVVVIGSIGVAIIQPIITVIGCP